VTFGTQEPLVHMPLGDTSLADASQTATWIVRIAGVVALIFIVSRLKLPGWAAWLIAVGALAYVGYDLASQITSLKHEAAAAGDPAFVRTVEQTLAETHMKPGAVYLASGLMLQLLALLVRPHRTPEKKSR
jgi:hypothetical protein